LTLAVSSATVAAGGLRRPAAKTLGVAAVLGMVVALSLSSTLAKRAETPGVLIAFWRMLAVSLLWNFALALTGRRVTLRDVRQVALPGIFFGLNLAAFFVGVTHNSVANAALIGSLVPFLVVPAGALFFGEYLRPFALVFAVVAFGGTALVLLNAPTGGDATLRGNVFALIALLLLAAYITSTRAFRRDMDVTTFMATICPIAAFAVAPVAIADGGIFDITTNGWTFIAILTLTSGVTAQGLLVYAQRSVQIGTIGIASVAQPALAVVWSYLLLDEVIDGWQALGIAMVMGGLLAFVVLHQRRPDRAR
jgi:drug/metabolite transporter (DMT)-like permease